MSVQWGNSHSAHNIFHTVMFLSGRAPSTVTSNCVAIGSDAQLYLKHLYDFHDKA